MPEQEQRAKKLAPYNGLRGHAEGQLRIDQEFCAVRLGETVAGGEGAILEIDGREILALRASDHGRLELSVDLEDSSGLPIAIIDRNEWIGDSAGAWDLEFAYRTLTIRNHQHQIALSIDARREVVEIRAQLWRNGQQVNISPAGLYFSTTDLRILGAMVFVGMKFCISSDPPSLQWVPTIDGRGRLGTPGPGETPYQMARRFWRELKGFQSETAPQWARFDDANRRAP
ncbi:MAG: hypothetical protein O2843_01275 [Chloroflexi bacterium]|nr:hypothetical protein [Chloroflexota bacterium]